MYDIRLSYLSILQVMSGRDGSTPMGNYGGYAQLAIYWFPGFPTRKLANFLPRKLPSQPSGFLSNFPGSWFTSPRSCANAGVTMAPVPSQRDTELQIRRRRPIGERYVMISRGLL